MIVVAGIIGAVFGVLSCLPFAYGLRRVRKATVSNDSVGQINYAGILLASFGLSALVLFGSMLVCAFLCKDVLVPYAIGEVIALLVGVIVFVINRARSDKARSDK